MSQVLHAVLLALVIVTGHATVGTLVAGQDLRRHIQLPLFLRRLL